MKETIKRFLLAVLSFSLFAISSVANAASPCPTEGEFYFASEGASGTCRARTPDEVWADLLAGNASYTSSNTSALDQISTDSQPVPRQLLGVKGQKPEAIILTCSDSRLPPEILFNSGLGKLFVIRVAGNVVDPHELGSIEYAVEHLGTRLIVVLGHENCGAVKAAYDAYPTHPADPTHGIGSLVESIFPAITNIVGGNAKAGTPAEMTACVQENVNIVIGQLKSRSTIITEYIDGRAENLTANPPVEAIAPGTVKIYNAYYKLDTGVVTGAPATP